MESEPELMRDGWELESAEERHRAHPDRFDIPVREERENLTLGQRIKLLFLILGRDEDGEFIQCERMWVTVVEVNETKYVGVLESLPQTSDVLSPGDRVTFSPEHVATILIPCLEPSSTPDSM